MSQLIPQDWAPISLEELNAKAAMQTRIDRKYIVEAHRAAAVLKGLDADASVLEMGAEREFAYDSVYFDTPDLESYRLGATGRRNRYKVRTRSYLDTGDTFLEVKTEGARSVTVKERIPYNMADRARLNPEGQAYLQESLAGLTNWSPADFSPVVATGYRRTTVFLPESEENAVDARMTIDTNLTWTPMAPQATSRAGGIVLGHTYQAQGMVIIETKSGTAPSVADKHLWRAGVRPAKISKFATGMAALNPALGANKWHRTIAQDMHLVPVDSAHLDTSTFYAVAA